MKSGRDFGEGWMAAAVAVVVVVVLPWGGFYHSALCLYAGSTSDPIMCQYFILVYVIISMCMSLC